MKVVVTAGPTREHLDPVRFLSNPSTGKMGFAIAEAASKAGYETVLIAGPVTLKTPSRLRRIDVVSAREMLKFAMSEMTDDSVFIATAAVADFRPMRCAEKKLKKASMGSVIRLVKNPDILKSIRRKYKGAKLVGFAAETNDVLSEASRKCREKGLEFIVANDVTLNGAGFGTDTNKVFFVYPNGAIIEQKMMTKKALAKKIIHAVFHT
jgi:phosphopantothenoylcysteine decarboxylase/phosphopantothenate--cysteine ligase